MNKRRLLKLADLLDADAKNKKGIKFDFHIWAYADDAKAPMSCGTTACAMGLAVVSGSFKKAGVDYRIGNCGKVIPLWNGRKSTMIGVARRLFELSDYAAHELFIYGFHGDGGEGAKAERSVAKSIRRFVANNGAV